MNVNTAKLAAVTVLDRCRVLKADTPPDPCRRRSGRRRSSSCCCSSSSAWLCRCGGSCDNDGIRDNGGNHMFSCSCCPGFAMINKYSTFRRWGDRQHHEFSKKSKIELSEFSLY